MPFRTLGPMSRAFLLQQDLQNYRLPLTIGRNADGSILSASDAANNFHVVLGAWDTGGATLVGETATGGGTKTDTSVYTSTVPSEYVAAESALVIIYAKYTESAGGAATAHTIDINFFELGAAGTPGSELCTTAAQIITTTNAGYSFAITSATLLPGDAVQLFIQGSITVAGAPTGYITVGAVYIQLDIKG